MYRHESGRAENSIDFPDETDQDVYTPSTRNRTFVGVTDLDISTEKRVDIAELP